MIELLISDGHGPGECQLAAKHVLEKLMLAAKNSGLHAEVRERLDAPYGIRSAVVALQGAGAQDFAAQWMGTVQWIWQSRLRPKHARKNWFVGIFALQAAAQTPRGAIVVETCKAGGKGGQHVNKTRSAVRVTDTASGLAVKIARERSQHANKRLALSVLAAKQAANDGKIREKHAHARHRSHWQVQRGGAVKVFVGDDFVET